MDNKKFSDLYPYYERELTYLRKLAKGFASEYPKAAGRLQLSDNVSADPHVNRLIEAFAFLAARIHKKLDDEFPEITDALLGMIYPHYLRPIPSMAIVQLNVNYEKNQISNVYKVPRHAKLSSREVKGMHCQFRTCYPVELWPVKISHAKFLSAGISSAKRQARDSGAALQIGLTCIGDMNWQKLKEELLKPNDDDSSQQSPKLRFFLAGEASVTHALYEILCNNVQQIGISANDKEIEIPRESIRPVGFEQNDGLLDYGPQSFIGYRLLHEYFSFPEKFLFLDLYNLDEIDQSFNKELTVTFYLSELQRQDRTNLLEQAVNPDTFRLACTPIINLFKQQAEPITLNHQKTEYLVIPDVRHPGSKEVYSIDSVKKVTRHENQGEEKDFYPFYSLKHVYDDKSQKNAYWCINRREFHNENEVGGDVFISLVDLDFKPQMPQREVLSISLTCTNRDLPARLPFGANENDFEIDGHSAVTSVRCLTKPTKTLYPSSRRSAQWRLISHLTLNHLSIVEGGRDALLEILSLYNFTDSDAIKNQLNGILEVNSRSCVRRVRQSLQFALVQGTEITLHFDEENYAGSSVYLFANVLSHFFGLYTGLNSFTQLIVTTKQREKELAKWHPRSGETSLV